MAAPPAHKSASNYQYLFIMSLLVKSEVEVENGFLQILGQIHLLPAFTSDYLYSLTMTVSEFFTEIMSVSPLELYFLERGRLRIATRILGCSIFKI